MMSGHKYLITTPKLSVLNLVKVFVISFRNTFTYPEYPLWLLTLINNKNKELVVISKGSIVVGIMIIDYRKDKINTLYVVSRYRGIGVGNKLIGEAKKRLNNKVTLTISNKIQSDIEGFYFKNGFLKINNFYVFG